MKNTLGYPYDIPFNWATTLFWFDTYFRNVKDYSPQEVYAIALDNYFIYYYGVKS